MRRARTSLRSFVSGFKIFASTPFAARKLPPRITGKKRKPFSLTVFTTQSWKRVTGKRRVSPTPYLAMEDFASYINRIDDILDQLNHPSVIREKLTYKKDPVARRHISAFVQQVRHSKLSREQKQELVRLAGNFRRKAWIELERFEKAGKFDSTHVLEFKERTTGGMGRVLVAMLNVSERIPKDQRTRIENAFSDAFMATQIPDDIFDLREDHANRVPNIAISVLQIYPAELEAALKAPKTSIQWLQERCPKSYLRLEEMFNHYMSRLPSRTPSERAFLALPVIFWKISRLTRR